MITSPRYGYEVLSSDCLSVCSHISETTHPNFTKFSVRYVWLDPLTLCTSGLVDEVLFPQGSGNRPESKTMSRVCSVRQVAEPGSKHAVSDCIFF